LHRAMTLSQENKLLIEPPVRQTPAAQSSLTRSLATPLEHDQNSLPSDLQSHLDHQEREILIQALRASGFNRTAAAARLGLSLRQIRYRIARLHIDTPHNGEASDEAL
jgi:two-component system, NtrC family, response regulator PilR